MSLIITVLFITLAIAVGLWLLQVLAFGIGLGIVVAMIGLAAILFTAIGFGGPLVFILYLLIRLFMILFVVGAVIGIFIWIKDTLFINL
jgi:hypothetical protein